MLKTFIDSSGMTQSEWAQLLEIREGYLSDLICGAKRPSLALAVRIERLTDGAVPIETWAREKQESAAAEGGPA